MIRKRKDETWRSCLGQFSQSRSINTRVLTHAPIEDEDNSRESFQEGKRGEGGRGGKGEMKKREIYRYSHSFSRENNGKEVTRDRACKFQINSRAQSREQRSRDRRRVDRDPFVRLRLPMCATGDRRRTVGDPVVRSTVPVLVL